MVGGGGAPGGGVCEGGAGVARSGGQPALGLYTTLAEEDAATERAAKAAEAKAAAARAQIAAREAAAAAARKAAVAAAEAERMEADAVAIAKTPYPEGGAGAFAFVGDTSCGDVDSEVDDHEGLLVDYQIGWVLPSKYWPAWPAVIVNKEKGFEHDPHNSALFFCWGGDCTPVSTDDFCSWEAGLQRDYHKPPEAAPATFLRFGRRSAKPPSRSASWVERGAVLRAPPHPGTTNSNSTTRRA